MAGAPRLRVAILYGGRSTEHEISILSARNVLEALDRSRFEPVLIGIDRQGRWLRQDERRLLASARDPREVQVQPGLPVSLDAAQGVIASADPDGARVDVVFPVLHGTLGEDGTIQGLCEVAGIPYVGAGVLGSAIGMDKDVMKRLLRDAGLPVAPFRVVHAGEFEQDPEAACREIATLGYPLFTKPANTGSSVGVRRVDRPADLPAALRHALEFDVKAIAEAQIVGREIEVAVLGGEPPRASVAGEIVVEHRDGFYSYDAKYVDAAGARLEMPARLEPGQLETVQGLALRAFRVLECEGMARVDFFLRPDGAFLVNEINTIPGFTAISMYPKLWELSGIPCRELVSRLIDLALARASARARLRRSVL